MSQSQLCQLIRQLQNSFILKREKQAKPPKFIGTGSWCWKFWDTSEVPVAAFTPYNTTKPMAQLHYLSTVLDTLNLQKKTGMRVWGPENYEIFLSHSCQLPLDPQASGSPCSHTSHSCCHFTLSAQLHISRNSWSVQLFMQPRNISKLFNNDIPEGMHQIRSQRSREATWYQQQQQQN